MIWNNNVWYVRIPENTHLEVDLALSLAKYRTDPTPKPIANLDRELAIEAKKPFWVIIQCGGDINYDLCVIFVDSSKAYNRYNHQIKANAWITARMDEKDIKMIISEYHWGQRTAVQVLWGPYNKSVQTQKKDRQGCVLVSPLLTFYPKEIFSKALENIDKRVKINDEAIYSIWYTDGTILISNSLQSLKNLQTKLRRKLNITSSEQI